MDLLRTLLVAGLALLFWNARFRGVRPVRDFVLWGCLYPFHFALMGLLILVIWGLIGADYGLQGLFLTDNPWVQALLGVGVMLLFSALILHYSLLDTPARWRDHSLGTLVRVLRDLNRSMPPAFPVQRLLANGFLERFGRDEIEAIDDAIRREEEEPAGGHGHAAKVRAELQELLRAEPFRLLVAPAILLVKGLALVALIGVMPAVVIPLLNRDPRAIAERLPWLAGVAVGEVVGIALACRTTRWAARAAGWEEFPEKVLHAIRGWVRALERARPSVAAEAPATPRAADPGRAHGPGRRGWLALLGAFFAIHFVVNVVVPDRWSSRWIDPPEATYLELPGAAVGSPTAGDLWGSVPWLPLGVLAGEAVGATVALAGLRRLWRGSPGDRCRAWVDRVGLRLGSASVPLLAGLSEGRGRRIAIGGVVLLALLAAAAPGWLDPRREGPLREGIEAAVALGAFLAVWLAGFRMACGRLASAGLDAAEQREWRVRLGSAGALVGLVLVYLAGAPWPLVIAAAVAAIFGRLAATMPAGDRRSWTGVRGRAARVAALVAGAGALLAMSVRLGATLATGAWVGAAVLVLGSEALAGVGRRRPALLYPLSLLLGFVAFALGFNAARPAMAGGDAGRGVDRLRGRAGGGRLHADRLAAAEEPAGRLPGGGGGAAPDQRERLVRRPQRVQGDLPRDGGVLRPAGLPRLDGLRPRHHAVVRPAPASRRPRRPLRRPGRERRASAWRRPTSTASSSGPRVAGAARSSASASTTRPAASGRGRGTRSTCSTRIGTTPSRWAPTCWPGSRSRSTGRSSRNSATRRSRWSATGSAWSGRTGWSGASRAGPRARGSSGTSSSRSPASSPGSACSTWPTITRP